MSALAPQHPYHRIERERRFLISRVGELPTGVDAARFRRLTDLYVHGASLRRRLIESPEGVFIKSRENTPTNLRIGGEMNRLTLNRRSGIFLFCDKRLLGAMAMLWTTIVSIEAPSKSRFGGGGFTQGKLGQKIADPDALDDPTRCRMTTLYLTRDEMVSLDVLVGNPLIKRRHRLDAQGYVWAVDAFEAPAGLAGLVIAEVECPTDAALALITTPSWAQRELTGLAGWSGAALAQTGCPPE